MVCVTPLTRVVMVRVTEGGVSSGDAIAGAAPATVATAMLAVIAAVRFRKFMKASCHEKGHLSQAIAV